MREKPTHIIIHFGEVILKGTNRAFFERKLIDDMAEKLTPHGVGRKDIIRGYGRAIITLPENADADVLCEVLRFVPGIANFAFGVRAENNIDEISKKAISLSMPASKTNRGESMATFAIETHRADKRFPLTSQEVNTHVGAEVQKATGSRVNLNAPAHTIFIEITDDATFIYVEKVAGMGGLPRGTSGHGVVLLSGGIDSPVAAYKMLTRGMTISAVHFHSLPKTSPESIEKVRILLQKLARIQPNIALYLVPLVPVQQQIVKNCPDKLRVVIQRRFMARIAERVAGKPAFAKAMAGKEKAQALITGDALGQVASQTIENIAATEDASEMPVFRPLIGSDKQAIVDTAQKIGTYDTSILPHEDCCTAFMPDKPETKARLADVKKAEEALDVEGLVEEAVAQAEVETVTVSAEL